MGTLHICGGCPMPLQAMPRAIRPTKWREPASVFSPRVRRARGLQRPNQTSRRLVEAGRFGFRWLRTKSCQRVTRCHSSWHTSGSRRPRLPQFQEHRPGRHRLFLGQPLQDG